MVNVVVYTLFAFIWNDMRYVLLLISCCIVLNCFGQRIITPSNAHKHIGDTVAVFSRVYGVKKTNTMTYLYLGASFPNSPLSVAIPAEDLPYFWEAPEKLYNQKRIIVTGKVWDNSGRPEIIITSPMSIRFMLDSAARSMRNFQKRNRVF